MANAGVFVLRQPLRALGRNEFIMFSGGTWAMTLEEYPSRILVEFASD